MSFNLVQLFDDLEIKYWEKGKNCTIGFVNIQCPYCKDKSNHLGINIKSGKAVCWKCGSQGSIYNVIETLLDIDRRESKKTIDKYKTDFIPDDDEIIEKEKPSELILPKEAVKTFSQMHIEYLEGRNFDPISLQRKYRLLACDMFGEYKYRIIIPIFIEKKLVNFAAMSVGGASKKIMNCPNDKVVIQRNHLLYNFDNIENRKAIVVEGFADCWRMGDGCVATLGTKFTPMQVKLLAQACDEVYIMFDSEEKDSQAPMQAEKFANQLSGLIKKVEVIYLDHGDPADLSNAEARQIKADLFSQHIRSSY